MVADIMDNIRNKYMQLATESLKTCSLIVSDCSEGKEKEQQFNKLVEIMECYCELDTQYENSLKAMSEAKKLLKSKRKENEQGDSDDRSIREVYKEILDKKEKKLTAKSSAELKAFKDHIESLQKETSEAAEDVEMSEISLNPVDPLTKKIMVNPVRSSKCGHTFEKESIESLLTLKKKLRCPIPGCPHQITKNDLTPDLQMKQFLQKISKSQQHEATQPGPSSHVGMSL